MEYLLNKTIRLLLKYQIIIVFSMLTHCFDLNAQEIEPRAYSNAPIGVNFFISGYAYTQGDLSFGSNLPITDAQLHTSNAVLAPTPEF